MLTSLLASFFSSPADTCPTLSSSPTIEGLFDLPIIDSVLGGTFPKTNIDCNKVPLKDGDRKKQFKSSKVSVPVMCDIDPEEDLKRLIDNETKLRLCNYYYGNLSWVDATHILKKSPVGTFLVRDSEHSSYLYTLSVQTRRGPTSCRIDYENGRFRLDSIEDLSDKMPRFDTVTDLVDHYIYLTKNLPKKTARKEVTPVWMDMEDENNLDVPVQIYKPLYKNVRSLQHLCRVNLVKLQRDGHLRTNIDDNLIPTMLKNYLKEYPHPQ